jgi:serine/threonine protein kinase
MYAYSPEDYRKWEINLKKSCVLMNFNRQFTNAKIIGKGTFAKVLLSKRISDNQQYAVKTYDKKKIQKQDQDNRSKIGLINEIRIMRILKTEACIKLYELYEGEGHIYLVVDLLQGGELFDRIIE